MYMPAQRRGSSPSSSVTFWLKLMASGGVPSALIPHFESHPGPPCGESVEVSVSRVGFWFGMVTNAPYPTVYGLCVVRGSAWLYLVPCTLPPDCMQVAAGSARELPN